MINFRSRVPTEHPEVHRYIFADTDQADRYRELSERYAFLIDKARSQGLSPEEKIEMPEIVTEVALYKKQQSLRIKSILSGSQVELPIGSGKDNIVVTDAKDGRYVYKYSVPSYQPTPNTVEYLIKKYKMLKRFLGKSIPKSCFVLGERRVPFSKKTFHKLKTDNSSHIITIQRKVSGKTLTEMSRKERDNPKLLEALKEAHSGYISLKRRIRRASEILGLPEDTLDVKLDLGGLSKQEDITIFESEKLSEFSTPNIMYDDENDILYFIDFDMNEWNEDKQKVYDLVMSEEELQ